MDEQKLSKEQADKAAKIWAVSLISQVNVSSGLGSDMDRMVKESLEELGLKLKKQWKIKDFKTRFADCLTDVIEE